MHNHTLPIKLIKSNKVPPLKLGLKNERCFILFAIAINTRLSICSSFFFFFLNKPFWPEIHVSWGNPQIGKRIKITLINKKKKKMQTSELWALSNEMLTRTAFTEAARVTFKSFRKPVSLVFMWRPSKRFISTGFIRATDPTGNSACSRRAYIRQEALSRIPLVAWIVGAIPTINSLQFHVQFPPHSSQKSLLCLLYLFSTKSG